MGFVVVSSFSTPGDYKSIWLHILKHIFFPIHTTHHKLSHDRTEGTVSEKRTVAWGVPQGSVLGPLLFLLYVNDIYNASEKFKFHLFADDTNLLYGDKNLKSLETIVTAELSKVWDWLNANKLTLNVKKSNFVIFQPKGRRSNNQVKIKLIDNNTKVFYLSRTEGICEISRSLCPKTHDICFSL